MAELSSGSGNGIIATSTPLIEVNAEASKAPKAPKEDNTKDGEEEENATFICADCGDLFFEKSHLNAHVSERHAAEKSPLSAVADEAVKKVKADLEAIEEEDEDEEAPSKGASKEKKKKKSSKSSPKTLKAKRVVGGIDASNILPEGEKRRSISTRRFM